MHKDVGNVVAMTEQMKTEKCKTNRYRLQKDNNCEIEKIFLREKHPV